MLDDWEILKILFLSHYTQKCTRINTDLSIYAYKCVWERFIQKDAVL
jgi:hypothetical protein